MARRRKPWKRLRDRRARKKSNCDPPFQVTLPNESRLEARIRHQHNTSEWKFRQREYHWRCGYCGIHRKDTPEGYLTRDHIIPIRQQGSDQIQNIVPACRRCNFRKGNRCPGEPTYYGPILFPKPLTRRRIAWSDGLSPIDPQWQKNQPTA